MGTFLSKPLATRALLALIPAALLLGLLVMAPAQGQGRAPLAVGTELLSDGGFEAGSSPSGTSAFTAVSGAWGWQSAGSAGSAARRYYSSAAGSSHSGNWCLYFDLGPSTDRLTQTVSIPAGVTATLSYWLRIGTSETSVTTAYDTLKVSITDASGVPFGTDTYSNLDASDGYVWVKHTRDVSAYAGRTIGLQFDTFEDATNNTLFVLDDVSILASATGSSCVEDAFTMCLVNGRYRVTSRWKNQYDGSPVAYLSKAKLTDKTGAFWNGDASTYEYMIRFNTATNNGRVWIAIPTFTDVEFWVSVTDTTVNGKSMEYHNPPGSQALIYDPNFFVYP